MGAPMFSASQRIVLLVLCTLLIIALVNRQRQIQYAAPAPPAPPVADTNPASSLAEPPEKKKVGQNDCGELPGIEDVVLVLKTGATEIYDKVPIFFHTIFSCGTDYLIYSDHAQDLGRTQVRDALALMSDEARERSGDLEQYRNLRQHFDVGGEATELKGERNWEIDRFKFLPMISDAYRTFGSRKKWYVFIEADTYISLHNLLLWLQKLDANKPIYAGAQIFIGATEFAHGGSGFVMSGTAAKALREVYEKDQARWDEKLAPECCGDKLMAEALLEATPEIGVLRSFPIIQGETPASLDWSVLHWCRPAVSWHHVDPTGIDKLWQFEKKWRKDKGASTPILFADYYAAFVHPRLEAANWTMEAWDNLSRDWTFEDSDESEEAALHAVNADTCRDFCESQSECFQWVWSPGTCRASRDVKLGWALSNRPALGSADDRVMKVEEAISGWFPERIDEYRRARSPCTSQPWITENRD